MLEPIRRWFTENVVALGREMRWSYLPPLMVYLAAGVSDLTAIAGTFFVKEYLGLSAAFLATLAFWAGIPWALKMPLGHLVDLIWRHKAALVWLGAGLIAASLSIMLGLVSHPETMRGVLSLEAWFVVSTLLAPLGYVLQDVVADAMTVEAVPRVDAAGVPLPATTRRLMNTTLQTLGRVAIIGGGILVSVVNVVLFKGSEALPQAEKAALYADAYALALFIPLLSVAGVVLAGKLRRYERTREQRLAIDPATIETSLAKDDDRLTPNWWIIGGSLAFAALSLGTGVAEVRFGEEIVFIGSLSVITFLMYRLLSELDDESRRTLLGTAIVVFAFRATPGPGEGSTWWMIDVLGFDQSFLAKLSLLTSALTLFGLFAFRRFMGERSITYVVGFLTIAGTLLSLPTLGMYYGLHEWTAAHTAGLVDARFIALANTALESPLGQIAMVPMLAWIANSAPDRLKATYFAVMASFSNLALSASQLGTKYLNHWFPIARETRDPLTHAITAKANYDLLGWLLLASIALDLLLPFAAIWATRACRLRSA